MDPCLKADQEECTREMMEDELLPPGATARPHQVNGIRQLHYYKRNVCIVAKTGSGKGKVALGASIMMGGISLMVVPFLALGASLVADEAETCPSMRLEHVDDLTPSELQDLIRELDDTKTIDDLVATLYISPQSLEGKSPLKECIKRLLRRGLISLVGIDEMHRLPIDGAWFRTEFAHLRTNLFNLLSTSPVRVPVVGLTATLTYGLLKAFEKRTGVSFAHFEIGDMTRRNIKYSLRCTHQVTSLYAPFVKKHRAAGGKVVILSQFPNRVETNIAPAIQKVLDDGEDVACVTGNTPDAARSYRVSSFCASPESPPFKHMNASVLAATKAANCGVNCPSCYAMAFDGPPSDLVDLVQGAGRIRPQEHGYPYEAMFALSVASWTKLVLRIAECSSAEERETQTGAAMKVMRLILCPGRCMHVELENEFGHPNKPNT